MKTIIFPFLLLLLGFIGYSQPLITNWQQCYGGSEHETGYTVQKVGNGFLLFGETNSTDGQVVGNHGNADYWLIKTDLAGNIQWQKCYGGTDDEISAKMIPCMVGGFLLCGSTWSATPSGGYNGDVYGNHGGSDYWLIKVDSLGTIEWTKCYGGSYIDIPIDITPTPDSGFLICGMSNSPDGDVTGNHGIYDVWVVRINHSGTIKWEKSFGGSMPDWANSILSTSDGGFIFCGNTQSNDGNVLCNLHGRSDTWIVKGDSLGNIEWQRCYGGSDYETGDAIQFTPDGGYVFISATNSNDGDVTGNHGGSDIWAVKIDHDGTLVWQKCYGGSLDETGLFIKPGNSGSFIIGGSTDSYDGEVSGSHSVPPYPSYDMWLIKISSEGNLLWQKCLGGNQDEYLSDIFELPNGQMMLLGSAMTSNNSGDVQCDHHGPGTNDVWFLSIADTTEVGIKPEQDKEISIISYPNPVNDAVTFEYAITGIIENPTITIFNELGSVIQVIPLAERKGNIQWNTGKASSAIYYYLLRNDQVLKSGKIIVLKQ